MCGDLSRAECDGTVFQSGGGGTDCGGLVCRMAGKGQAFGCVEADRYGGQGCAWQDIWPDLAVSCW